MAPKPVGFRAAIWLSGGLLVAAAAGGGLFWLRLRDDAAKPPAQSPRAAELAVAVADERPVERRPVDVDAREVCRELTRQRLMTAADPPPAEDVTLPAEPRPVVFDNRPEPPVEFATDIRPLLANHCYRCHGPDRQEAGLRFDLREPAFQATMSAATPIVAGDPAHSELLARITADDPTVRMPLGAPPLSPGEVERLREWIEAGAEWPEDARHWAFVKPQAARPPRTADPGWSRDVIDAFISVRHESIGLAQASEADRATLIRRLSLDLLGLPPTPEEVDEFAADDAPDAVERLVDRLLASPHFGEKWAIRWLDLSRYADTNGFEFDAPRTMWLYRDWVIDALNRDLPFDQFTVEQLAGDLLPDATDWQRVATGFLRNSAVAPDLTTHRFDMLVDRVNTLGSTWFGLTFSCAQCHNHKFDPLTQREYYELYAILNNSIEEVAGAKYRGCQLDTESPLCRETATALVLEERLEPNVTHLKVRGSATEDGEGVEPGVPGFLHAARCGEGDRLSLACWLIDEDNPLTARVAVNRLWESLFGTGLVRTSEDFGVRGELPSHPQLLDWLAVDLQRGDWSQKRMLRRLACSATYRQSSHVTPQQQERDPQNRLLARGPRFRVDAEVMRDIALAASGLLSTKLGGPSVFPWQPPGTSENVEFASFAWKVSPDENRYRRGLYTHWKRRTLYPSFAMFDAPNRTSTCTRRERTMNPLQALVTLNDPVLIEAAVYLAGRMLDETDGAPPAAIARGFRLCVGRAPGDEELTVLQRLYAAEHNRLTGDRDAALTLVGGADAAARFPQRNLEEWAAYTVVANVLLSLDETITRE